MDAPVNRRQQDALLREVARLIDPTTPAKDRLAPLEEIKRRRQRAEADLEESTRRHRAAEQQQPRQARQRSWLAASQRAWAKFIARKMR